MKTWLLKKTGPLELLLAAIIVVCVYFQHLQDIPFYPDESQWIATSFYFESLLGIKPSTPEWLQLYRSTSGYTNTNWAENYWTLTQPPVTRPQIAVILAVPFLFNRRRTWWWFCGGAAFLALYSLALVRFEGVRVFISLLRISAIGQGFGMNQNAMFNFTGLVLRLLPYANIDTVHIIAWGMFLAIIIGLCIIWKVSPEIHYRHIVLAVVMSVFAAPHLHYHDLVLLLIPVLGLAIILVKGCRLKVRKVAALLVLVSVVMMFGELWDPLRYTFPYLLMIGFPALTWFYETQ